LLLNQRRDLFEVQVKLEGKYTAYWPLE